MLNSDLFKVSDLVVSMAFGIGRIVAIESVSAASRDFYQIQSVDRNMKTMVPVKAARGVRRLSPPEDFLTALDSLTKPFPTVIYPSKKDRILNFKQRCEASCLEDLLDLIRELNSLHDRGSIENKLLLDLQSFLSKEYAFLFNISQEDALSTVITKCKSSTVS